MTENRTDAKTDEAKGRVKKAAGEITGDEDLKDEGSVDKATGTAKDKVSDAADKAKDLADRARDKVRGD